MTDVWGITGSVGSGKTHLGEKLWKHLDAVGMSCTVIRIDELRYTALTNSWENRHRELRTVLSSELGFTLDDDGTVDYGVLYGAVFSDRKRHADFSRIISPVLAEDAAEIIREAEGTVLLEGAMLLEEGYGHLLTAPLILVSCSEEERDSRFPEKGGNRSGRAEMRKRLDWQPTDRDRENLAYRTGIELLRLDTTDPVEAASVISALAARISDGVSEKPRPVR